MPSTSLMRLGFCPLLSPKIWIFSSSLNFCRASMNWSYFSCLGDGFIYLCLLVKKCSGYRTKAYQTAVEQLHNQFPVRYSHGCGCTGQICFSIFFFFCIWDLILFYLQQFSNWCLHQPLLSPKQVRISCMNSHCM